MNTKPRVAIFGLGLMGMGMANRLLDEGFSISVYNRSMEKTAVLAARGAHVAETPRDAAIDADVLIAMVADDNASRSVWLGENGALATAKRGAILIESSTLSPAWVRDLSTAAAKQGCSLLDSPVTGSKPHAASGQLLFLVGGEIDALERAKPVLSVLSRDIIHLGPVGSGAVMKLINNFVCGVQVVAIAEALAWIERSGLQPDSALKVLTEGAPGSPLVKLLSSRMVSRDYTPNFHLKLMAKDLDYALTEAGLHSIPLTTARAAHNVMSQANAAGHGNQDFSSVVELLRAIPVNARNT